MRLRNRVYDEAIAQAVTVLWEAADRVCGKRLKSLIPMLVDAMERHGHLDLDPVIKTKVLQVSAATIDRVLAGARAHIDGQRKRCLGVGAAIRRSIPVRTLANWLDRPPGCFEIDMVEHCGGPKTDGDYIHTLTAPKAVAHDGGADVRQVVGNDGGLCGTYRGNQADRCGGDGLRH